MKNNLSKIKLNKKMIGTIGGDFLWQKSAVWAALIILALFVFGVGYLLLKPIDKKTESLINKEIQAILVSFDKKTLTEIKEKKQPQKSEFSGATKNPFSSF